MSQVHAAEFFITVGMSDLLHWHGDGDGVGEPEPSLAAALLEASLAVDVRAPYKRYFEEIPIGCGDAYRYSSCKDDKTIFAISLYRELTDQLDIVSFGMVCDRAKVASVSCYLHTFFRQASVQIAFEQSCHCRRLRELIDPTRYPLIIEESGYTQKLIAAP